MAVTRKTDLAGYRYQVSVGGFAARPCLIPRWGKPFELPPTAPRGGGGGGRSSLNIVLTLRSAY